MPIFINHQPRDDVEFAGILPPDRYLSLASSILPAIFSILQHDKHTAHKRVDTHVACTQFGRIIDRAAEKNERFVIEQRGRLSSSIKLGTTSRAANGFGFMWETRLPAANGMQR
ncbi:MAG: hypothetical protein JO189_26640 [Deltaproteobacteria bacterium]|nr:hypothetical protein [Deltaproteobacteria bacterium]